MKTFAVPANRMIQLPNHLFKPAIIKKIESPQLSEIAARVKERALPMREILREVQAHRRAQRAR